MLVAGFVIAGVGDRDPNALLTALAGDPRVVAVQGDHRRAASGVPSDPMVADSGYMKSLRLPRAWDVGNGSGAVIAKTAHANVCAFETCPACGGNGWPNGVEFRQPKKFVASGAAVKA